MNENFVPFQVHVLLESLDADDDILRRYVNAVVPNMLAHFSTVSAKGGKAFLEKCRREGFTGYHDKPDQSMVAHILNGIFPVMRIVKELERRNLQRFSEIPEIKRQRACDETPRFAKHGRGYVGLSQWLGSGLAYDIARHNQEVKRRLLARLREMAPEAFEELIAELLVALGFEDVQLTSYSKDGGIDVRGTLVVGEAIRTRIAVQVKRWQNNVGATVVQQVRGSLGTHEQGLIITTSGFGKRARAEAARADAVPVGLMDGGQLVDLLIENEIGVVRKMKRRSYPVRGDRFRTRGLVGSSRVSSRGGDEVVKGDRVEGGRVGHELDDESEHADSSRGVQQPTATGTRCRAQTAS